MPNQSNWTKCTAFFHLGDSAEMYIVDGIRGREQMLDSVFFGICGSCCAMPTSTRSASTIQEPNFEGDFLT